MVIYVQRCCLRVPWGDPWGSPRESLPAAGPLGHGACFCVAIVVYISLASLSIFLARVL